MLFNTLHLSDLNYLSILVATIVYFFLGAIWFSRFMFAEPWMASLNIKPETMDKTGLGRMMLISFITTFAVCFGVAVLIQLISIGSASAGIKLGLLLGIFMVFSTNLINSLFEKRPVKLLFINAGYHVVGITLASLIISVWH